VDEVPRIKAQYAQESSQFVVVGTAAVRTTRTDGITELFNTGLGGHSEDEVPRARAHCGAQQSNRELVHVSLSHRSVSVLAWTATAADL